MKLREYAAVCIVILCLVFSSPTMKVGWSVLTTLTSNTQRSNAMARITHAQSVTVSDDVKAAVEAERKRSDEWWMDKIESLGLVHSFREDGMEQGLIQTPIGKVLCSDGSLKETNSCSQPS